MKVISLIVSFVLFLGGLAIMGFAPEATGWEGITFFSGIVAVALAFFIPVHVLGKFD